MRGFVTAAAMWAGLPFSAPAPAPDTSRLPPAPAALSAPAVPGLAPALVVSPAPALAVPPVRSLYSAAAETGAAGRGPAQAGTPIADPAGAAFDGRGSPPGTPRLDADFAALHAAVREGRAGPLPEGARAASYLFVGGMFASRTNDYFGGNLRRLDSLGLRTARVALDTQGRRRAGLNAIEAAVRGADGPVVLVGHSRGGVLVHDWYRRAPAELKAKVARLVALQAPLTGTPVAEWALTGRWNRFKLRVFGPLLFRANLLRTAAEMTPRMRALVLRVLPGWAPGDLEKVYTVRTTVASLHGFYEKRRATLERLGFPDSDGMVPAASSRIEGANDVLIRDVEHKHTVLQRPGWYKRFQGYRPHPGYDAGDMTEALVRLMFR